MAEICLPLILWPMLFAPASGIQEIYVTSSQFVALYSQTPFKSSVAWPPQRARVIHLCCQYEPQEVISYIISLLLTAGKQSQYKKKMGLPIDSCFCGSRSPLFKRFLKLHVDIRCWMFGCHFLNGSLSFTFQKPRPE